MGLLFEAPSLRTRVGFEIATSQLGGQSVWLAEMRNSPAMDGQESFADTLRVLSGMVDLIVARLHQPLRRSVIESHACCPVINGGDAALGHPTQAIIDLFNIRTSGIRLDSTDLIVCGDATMRTVLSLVEMLEMFPPRSLTFVTPQARMVPDGWLGPNLRKRTQYSDSLKGVRGQVIYQCGLPAFGTEPLSVDLRAQYALSPQLVTEIGAEVVLSPLPLIDEISEEMREDPRFVAFEYSDRAVWSRMAVLEQLLMDQH